ncbi:MAG: TetR/AcrR family transcriptional regulator [Eubacterium sp.]|nr:TetR/AcrR family transcriptional regulator [Eubacterium sp.]
MSKLDEKKKKKREALFTAAFHLFNTKGIRQTSISDIAHEADVAKGTFYLYFKDKFDLRDKLIAAKATQILVQATEEVGIDMDHLDIYPLEEAIVKIVDVILDRMEREPDLLRFITKNLSWGAFHHMSLEDGDDAGEIDFNEGYHRMVDASGRRFDNPDLMLFMIVELVGGCSYQVILHEKPVGLEELKPHLYQSIRDIVLDHEIV